jgi:hypothetical protein
MKKTRSKKSRDTVPLKRLYYQPGLGGGLHLFRPDPTSD